MAWNWAAPAEFVSLSGLPLCWVREGKMATLSGDSVSCAFCPELVGVPPLGPLARWAPPQCRGD